MNKTKTIDGKVEVMRLLASLMIMCDHMGHLGLGDLPRPFRGTWIYVEYFLILSGFFTAKHFASSAQQSGIIENAVRYTIQKYKKFIPYTVCAVLLKYLFLNREFILSRNLREILFHFEDMPAEILMLSAANTNSTRLFTLWFLSATFLVSPFICILCQAKGKYTKLFLSFYPAVFYYSYRAHSIGAHEYPNQLIRAFCGMALGVLIFEVTEYVRSLEISTIYKSALTAITVLCYAVLFCIGWKGMTPVSTYLWCFAIIVCLTFSSQTFLPLCSNAVFLYLGKLSIPVFIWHLVLADYITLVYKGNNPLMLVTAYYGITIAVSAVCLRLFERNRQR